jgi:CheY-like chemotaxis protein
MAGPRKILIVEDNNELRKLYETFLEYNKFKVRAAVNGEDALAQAQEFKPDFVFLDIMMPKKDGYEVLKLLRHDPQYNSTRAKIVLLTNLGDGTNLSPETRRDMDGYAIKAEIVLNDLLEIIKSVG